MFVQVKWSFAAVVLAFCIAWTAPASSSAGVSAGTSSHRVKQSGESATDYWTPERMRNATPLDLPGTRDGAFGYRPLPELEPATANARTGPAVEISGTRGTLGTSYSTGTDSETSSANDTSYPQRIQGKIFFRLDGIGDFGCSGTVVTSPLRNLVVTAGHCVFGFGENNQYATNWAFVPGYRNGSAPLGVWPATNLYALNGWVNTGGFSFDLGMARIGEVGGNSIETLLGSRGIAFNQDLSVTPVDIWGYPARPNPGEDGFGDYDGERLILCSHNDPADNAIRASETDSSGGTSVGAAYCFMQQGSSGGGWIISGGFLNSVVSHGYCQTDPTHTVYPSGPCGLIFGPYFGAGAQNLYAAATTVQSPPPPPQGGPGTTQTAQRKHRCKKKRQRRSAKHRGAHLAKKKCKKRKRR